MRMWSESLFQQVAVLASVHSDQPIGQGLLRSSACQRQQSISIPDHANPPIQNRTCTNRVSVQVSPWRVRPHFTLSISAEWAYLSWPIVCTFECLREWVYKPSVFSISLFEDSVGRRALRNLTRPDLTQQTNSTPMFYPTRSYGPMSERHDGPGTFTVYLRIHFAVLRFLETLES